MEFKTNIRNERLSLDKTQKQIAEKLGVVESCYANWEQGRTEPDIKNIIKLCAIYKVSADYLLGLEDENGNKINQEVQTIHNDNRNYNINTKNHRGNINIK